jgi:cell division protein FtsX
MGFIAFLLGLLLPLLTNIFNPIFDKLTNEQQRKSVILLFNYAICIGLAVVVNVIGGYGLGFEDVALVGTGLVFPAQQAAYRGAKFIPSGKI